MALRVEPLAPPFKVESWLRSQPLTSFQPGNARTLSKRAGTIPPAISGGMLLLAACYLAIKNDLEPAPINAASGALAYVREHGVSGNVLNADSPGQKLIFRGIKTHIYGRADQLLLGGFAAEDHKSESSAGKPILEKLIAEHEIDWALLAAEDGRIPMLDELGGWRQAYKDENAVIYLQEGMDG
ncbi:hypothetical protein JQK88_16655 [Mesorhizobium caraganae]|uniref:hypothetical protein n=1 Tax=Mesorhizobium caraganae TaxID=483206 RepID=UPI00193A9FC8|nr:hypothetical protein [Mesorhizobium caraganae]MBM2712828.1 hypothetical protein [Mesorhizobium caraganae]